MGIAFNYTVPRRVKDAIDNMSTSQMADLICELQIPDLDMPDLDLYDWLRQRIFDWLYDPDWTEPTDRDAEEVALAAARGRVADTAREAERARADLSRLEASGNLQRRLGMTAAEAGRTLAQAARPMPGTTAAAVCAGWRQLPPRCSKCPFVGGCTVVDGRRACPAGAAQ